VALGTKRPLWYPSFAIILGILILTIQIGSVPRVNPDSASGDEYSFRLVSEIEDKEEPDLTPYIDIISATVETDDIEFYRFNMTLRGPLPDASLFSDRELDDECMNRR